MASRPLRSQRSTAFAYSELKMKGGPTHFDDQLRGEAICTVTRCGGVGWVRSRQIFCWVWARSCNNGGRESPAPPCVCCAPQRRADRAPSPVLQSQAQMITTTFFLDGNPMPPDVIAAVNTIQIKPVRQPPAVPQGAQ